MAEIPRKVKDAYTEYESERSHIEAFREKNRDLIRAYEAQLVRYNDAVNGVRAAIRDHVDDINARSYRDFDIQRPRGVDVDVLVSHLGHEAIPYLSEFHLVLTEAGMDELLPDLSQSKQERYFTVKGKLNRKAYDRAVRDQEIPADVADDADVEKTPKIIGAKPVDLFQ